MAAERDEAAAVEAVVVEVPILPKFNAVGSATSDRNVVGVDVVEVVDDDDEAASGWPSIECRRE